MIYLIKYAPAAIHKIFIRSINELPFIVAWFAISENKEFVIENVSDVNKTISNRFNVIGIKTIVDGERVQLSKFSVSQSNTLVIDCSAQPELAVALAVVCAAKGLQADIKGLQQLDVNIISLLQRELYRFCTLANCFVVINFQF